MRLSHLSTIVAAEAKPVRDIVVQILALRGLVDVRHASHADEAYRLICERVPSLVFLDLDTLKDGLAALRRIRRAADSPDRRLATIAMTGLPTHHRIAAMRDAGASDIVVKPLTAGAVLDRILGVVASPRPFIEVASFAGPDRRRPRPGVYAGPRRRACDRQADIHEIG